MFKKFFEKVVLLTLTAFLCTISVPSANAEPNQPETGGYTYNCSTAYEACEGAELVNGVKGATSSTMYVPAGEEILISCHNSGTKFQMGCKLYNSSGVAVRTVAVAATPDGNGNNWGYYTSPGGYFYLLVETGDYTSPYEGSGWGQFEYDLL